VFHLHYKLIFLAKGYTVALRVIEIGSL